jgi:hypothetical protein
MLSSPIVDALSSSKKLKGEMIETKHDNVPSGKSDKIGTIHRNKI